MKRVLLVAATLSLIALAFMPTAHAQEAQPVDLVEIGWWSTTPGAAEPDGGFQVAQDANGEPTAVAAMRIKVNVKSVASALVVFTEGPTKLSEASADIRVCKGTNTWTAANPGAIADAPKADCARSIQLKRSETLQSWSADVATLISGTGPQTLMMVPGDPQNGSIPFPSLEHLPQISLPVATPVGIPPPLPIDPGGPDPLGPLFLTLDCPPGYGDVTGEPCIGLPEHPATPLPQLPLPATIDLPFPIGFQIEITASQLSATSADDLGTAGGDDLGASGGGFSDSSGGFSDLSADGSGASSPLGDLVGTEVPSQEGASAIGTTGPTGVKLASSGGGRPWARIWLLAVVSAAVGAGSVWARRQTAALGR